MSGKTSIDSILDVEIYSQKKGDDAINAFNSLFDLDHKKNNVDKNISNSGFYK